MKNKKAPETGSYGVTTVTPPGLGVLAEICFWGSLVGIIFFCGFIVGDLIK